MVVYLLPSTEAVNYFSDRDGRLICSHTTNLEHRHKEGDEIILTFNPSLKIS
jgi:hypothetical protein